MSISRRDFIATSSAAAAGGLSIGSAIARAPGRTGDHGLADTLRLPDTIMARTGSGTMLVLASRGGDWTTSGLAVQARLARRGSSAHLPVVIESTRDDLRHVMLRWQRRIGDDPRVLGDTWERSYGDLHWQGLVPERALPWYFILRHGDVLSGYGVGTQPNTFCFWQCDADGVSLWLDLQNGGEPTRLAGRRLTACHVVMAEAPVQRPITPQLQAFCARLCPSPRLPKGPILGSNDWNYAYGKNNAAGILRDARLMVDLAPAGFRPFVVIDDGWQDKQRFPSLSDLAGQIRNAGARPGIWIRPLRAVRATAAPLLPASRFAAGADVVAAYDPSVADGLHAALQDMRDARSRGYEFIKHDFSMYDMLGQWGQAMGPRPARPGWQFGDRSRTTAEIVLDLYRSLRREAGEDGIILGCNTLGHLTAGLFESQRIGDDTSGRDWERTRRMGVNTLAFRIAQHRTFFHADPDIVAITRDVPWAMTRQWLDVVARSGTSLFIAPQPEAITPETRSAIRAAMAIAVASPAGYPADGMNSTTPRDWAFVSPEKTLQRYQWSQPETGADPFG